MTPQQIEAMAKQIQHDPVLLKKLCDRIYYLLKTDQRHQQERNGGRP